MCLLDIIEKINHKINNKTQTGLFTLLLGLSLGGSKLIPMEKEGRLNNKNMLKNLKPTLLQKAEFEPHHRVFSIFFSPYLVFHIFHV